MRNLKHKLDDHTVLHIIIQTGAGLHTAGIHQLMVHVGDTGGNKISSFNGVHYDVEKVILIYSMTSQKKCSQPENDMNHEVPQLVAEVAALAKVWS